MVKGSTAWGRLKVRSSIAALQTGRETNESRKRKREREGEREDEARRKGRQKFKRRKLALSEVWGNVCVCTCVCGECIFCSIIEIEWCR